MPTSRAFKKMNPPLTMPFSVLDRIRRYRETLLPKMPTPDGEFYPDQSQPPTADEQGSSNHRQGRRLGDAEASGGTSATTSPTLNGDGGGENLAGAEPGQLLVLEDVDEDAEGADATMRDELIMMARDNPIWMSELRKYLRKEEKEREQVQTERTVRLDRWREGIPT